ncbi:hypothetical protein [uncultured Alistipes sp.]|uniref:hypothetical protein n=1 Tax=uncultured Alistipes sp. TaxID=538949 RepID=UPI00261E4458|nr:hypothetical protein [uncultured Alistipes sp.]
MLRGCPLRKGETTNKASELGVARNLTVSKLPRTWQKLRYREALAAQANTTQNRRPEHGGSGLQHSYNAECQHTVVASGKDTTPLGRDK